MASSSGGQKGSADADVGSLAGMIWKKVSLRSRSGSSDSTSSSDKHESQVWTCNILGRISPFGGGFQQKSPSGQQQVNNPSSTSADQPAPLSSSAPATPTVGYQSSSPEQSVSGESEKGRGQKDELVAKAPSVSGRVFPLSSLFAGGPGSPAGFLSKPVHSSNDEFYRYIMALDR